MDSVNPHSKKIPRFTNSSVPRRPLGINASILANLFRHFLPFVLLSEIARIPIAETTPILHPPPSLYHPGPVLDGLCPPEPLFDPIILVVETTPFFLESN